MGVKGVFVINATTSSSSIPEASSTPFTVSGILSYVTNGSGVKMQPIRIIFLDNTNKSSPFYTPPRTYTLADGTFGYPYPNLNSLSPGDYKVVVQVPDIPGLNATRNLVVLAHQITPEQLNTVIAIIIGVITVITYIPKVWDHFKKEDQTNYLSMYLQQINKKYNEFIKDGNGIQRKRQYLDNLEDIRDTVTYLLQRRDISESQFKMLDDKISDYQQTISNAQ